MQRKISLQENKQVVIKQFKEKYKTPCKKTVNKIIHVKKHFLQCTCINIQVQKCTHLIVTELYSGNACILAMIHN